MGKLRDFLDFQVTDLHAPVTDKSGVEVCGHCVEPSPCRDEQVYEARKTKGKP